MNIEGLFTNEEIVAKLDNRLSGIDSEIEAVRAAGQNEVEQLHQVIADTNSRTEAQVAALEETRSLLQAKKDELFPPVIEVSEPVFVEVVEG